jgi:hypothetical protein
MTLFQKEANMWRYLFMVVATLCAISAVSVFGGPVLSCAAGEYPFDGSCRTEAWVHATFEPALARGQVLDGIVGSTNKSSTGHLVLIVSSGSINKVITYDVTSKKTTTTPALAGYELSGRNIFEFGSADRAWCKSLTECSAAGMWFTSLTESATGTRLLPWKTERALAHYGFASRWYDCDGTQCVTAIATNSVTPELLCGGMIGETLRKGAAAACQAGVSSPLMLGLSACKRMSDAVGTTTLLSSCVNILLNPSDLSAVKLYADEKHPMGASDLTVPALLR